MKKKLTEKIKVLKELGDIKKHYRIAKRHKSSEELEKVKHELLDFQNKLLKRNVLSEFIANEIHNLFYEIDYVSLKLIPSADMEW